MRKNSASLCCFVLLATACLGQEQPFEPLRQLSGTWKMQTGGEPLYESWIILRPEEMRSKNFRLQGKDTVILEEVRLVKQDDDIFYISAVKDQNSEQAISFKLISNVGRKFIFENPSHDFPQRIIYNLISNDSLHAWIEGKNAGKDARSDYYFKRVK